MESVKILFVLCLILECCNCWVNKFDEPVWYECPAGEQLSSITSEHDNHFEDRQWDFTCAHLAPLGLCSWHNNINQHDGVMDFKCPDSGAITGIKSVHDNNKEDRIYHIECCAMSNTPNVCKLTDYANEFDGLLDYKIPTNKYLNGIYSVHQNFQEDRRFKFNECDLS
ncbi:hemagglutinin/amebocyte aggregation factor-like [Patella vulgata]|uniref:hemagglutinin/amebocyte aggregation factor-like n=1 Tax=Patella vulgata TaxID=6465 RepID=UPI0024A975C2|nr:hemagglutinin/amebocyte aggregation factor-like [Patella vulgata]